MKKKVSQDLLLIWNRCPPAFGSVNIEHHVIDGAPSDEALYYSLYTVNHLSRQMKTASWLVWRQKLSRQYFYPPPIHKKKDQHDKVACYFSRYAGSEWWNSFIGPQQGESAVNGSASDWFFTHRNACRCVMRECLPWCNVREQLGQECRARGCERLQYHC